VTGERVEDDKDDVVVPNLVGLRVPEARDLGHEAGVVSVITLTMPRSCDFTPWDRLLQGNAASTPAVTSSATSTGRLEVHRHPGEAGRLPASMAHTRW